ncbi:MAG: hypothetical protein WA628_24675 [Terriglobales bacterium]
MANTTAPLPVPEETPAQAPGAYTARAYAIQSLTSGMAAVTIPRRALQPEDVQIEASYCGMYLFPIWESQFASVSFLFTTTHEK